MLNDHGIPEHSPHVPNTNIPLPDVSYAGYKWRGWRTYAVSALTVIFGVLATTDWVAFFNNPSAGWTAIGVGIVMAAMRSFTSTPPFQPDTPKPGDFGYVPDVVKKGA